MHHILYATSDTYLWFSVVDLTMAAAAGPVPSANRQRLGTPSGHRGRRPGSGASSGTDYIATLIEELQISVAEGDLEKSTAAVRQLVAHRTSLSIALNTSPPSTDPRYQEITSVKLF